MCGIAGLVNLSGEPVSPVALRRMTDAIEHRGPDGEGQWIEGNVGFGHRRLAIIDLSPSGHQPMISSDHRYVLTYNGEVYNYRELRAELQAKGYWFRGQSDSEVVLNAFAEWGTDAFLRLNGMFALAIWDRKTQAVVLARDRYGVKPLYYSMQNNTLAFGSEQKAITESRSFTKKINHAALLEYFTFQNLFTDKTLLEDVLLLPAGNFAVLDLASCSLTQSRYWDYHFREPDHYASDQEYEEELSRLFDQAVKRQTVADVELGTYLSGGMDSGSITAVAAREFPFLKSFTCGFDLSSASGLEIGFDERVRAEAMSAQFKTEHYEMVLKAGDMERCLESLTWHLEEPRVGQSYPNFYVAKLASKFVKVVLSGAGGDELFGGYPWRYYRGAQSRTLEAYIDEYYLYWQRLIPNRALREVFKPIWEEVKDVWTRDIFRSVFLTHSNKLKTPEDYVNHSLYFEAKTFLHGLFVVEDKLSMAHGLETRVPFMDNDLVDFAMQCPIALKVKNLRAVKQMNHNTVGAERLEFYRRSNDGKQILRRAMAKLLPENIITAEKQGFSSPDASWFKGESINFVKERLLDKTAKIYGFLDYGAVNSLVRDHLEGRENRRLLIWSLLNVNEWMDQSGVQ